MQNPMRPGHGPAKTFSLPVAGCTLLSLVLSGCTPTEPKAAPPAPQATAPALAVPSPSESAPAPHESRHVRQLIQQVEQAYALGEADYRKGKLAQAKAEFDRAVDLMLLSGIDIKNDPALSEEFDHILDKVNALETEALKRGNGFVPEQEETPAEAAADVTFKVDPNLVAKAQADLSTTKSDLPLVVNDYVAAFINFFANTKRGHYTLLHSLQRAGRYRAMIERVMAEEGVPQDLIYLAVAESSFNPRALNRSSGAGGMWQFMPHDKFYGLAKTAYVDERFDPEKSTRAYARYMKFIYNQLGDWYLSMAAYNWGTSNVQHAVQKTGYADFWELYKRNNLPVDTKSYVPEILAAIIIANHPSEYGFDEIASDPPVLTDTVTINYAIDLRLIGDIVGASTEELEALNPSLLRRITPPDSSFDLHLPAGTGGLFERRVAAVPVSRRVAWRYHRVAPGETLAAIAREHHVNVDDLAAANQLASDADLTNVEGLAIPSSAAVSLPSSSASSSTASTRSSAPAVAEHAQSYKVRKGDTLVTIADRYGVSLSQLRQWNHLKGASTKIAAGRRLQVSDAATAPVRRATRGGKHAASEDQAPATTTKNCAPVKGKKHKGHRAAPCVVTSSSDSDSREDTRDAKRSKRRGAAAEPDAKTAETRSTDRAEKSAKRSEKSARRTEKSKERATAEVEAPKKESFKKEKAGTEKKAGGERGSSSSRKHAKRK